MLGQIDGNHTSSQFALASGEGEERTELGRDRRGCVEGGGRGSRGVGGCLQGPFGNRNS